MFEANEELTAGYQALAEELRRLVEAGDFDGARRLMNRKMRDFRVPARPPKSRRPRCGAMTRKGTPCQAPAVWLPGEPAPRNGRCRIHGGLSTGPKTSEGKARIAESNRRRAGKGSTETDAQEGERGATRERPNPAAGAA